MKIFAETGGFNFFPRLFVEIRAYTKRLLKVLEKMQQIGEIERQYLTFMTTPTLC